VHFKEDAPLTYEHLDILITLGYLEDVSVEEGCEFEYMATGKNNDHMQLAIKYYDELKWKDKYGYV